MCQDCIAIKAEKDADAVVIQHLQRRVKELEGLLKADGRPRIITTVESRERETQTTRQRVGAKG